MGGMLLLERLQGSNQLRVADLNMVGGHCPGKTENMRAEPAGNTNSSCYHSIQQDLMVFTALSRGEKLGSEDGTG